MKKDILGQFGGRVIRKFSGGGKTFIAGAVLQPEDVEKWPLQNRKALASSGNVEWHSRPADVVLDTLYNETKDDSIPSDDTTDEVEEEKPKSNRKRKPAKKK